MWNIFSRRLLAAPAACIVLAATANLNAADFKHDIIYQIITDRFFDGDPSNNNADGNYDPAGHSGTSVHGGDFKGIEQKLDYIKALGATFIVGGPVSTRVLQDGDLIQIGRYAFRYKERHRS